MIRQAFAVVMLLVLMWLGTVYSDRRQERLFTERIMAEKYCGEIDSVFVDASISKEPKIRLRKGGIYAMDNNELFKVGDSIMKRPGELKYYHITNRYTSVFYQDYQVFINTRPNSAGGFD